MTGDRVTSSTDRLIIDVTRLPDAYLRALELFADQLSCDPHMADARTFGAELRAAVRSVIGGRTLAWLEFVESTGFPDWATCVDALGAACNETPGVK